MQSAQNMMMRAANRRDWSPEQCLQLALEYIERYMDKRSFRAFIDVQSRIEPQPNLYDAALRVTDEALGDGAYVLMNISNPDPGVQSAIRRWSFRREETGEAQVQVQDAEVGPDHPVPGLDLVHGVHSSPHKMSNAGTDYPISPMP